jgi:hypothetical protein
VEGRCAEDAVECAIEGQELRVSRDEGDMIRETRLKVISRCAQHVFRNVGRDDVASREEIQKLGCDSSGAAACVKDGFVSAQRKR